MEALFSPGDPNTSRPSVMDRYLGMGFSCNPDTGAMAASMYHSVLKILETFQTSDLPVQSTPYSMDLFDTSADPTPVDQPSYQRLHLVLKAPLRNPASRHHDLLPQHWTKPR